MGKYFGTDGFRGEANVVLTVEHAFKVGRYLGWYYGQEHKARIVIGKDTRRSSYMFEYALAAGLTASGADAYLLHVTTTPSVSYVVRTEDFDCGIMISASHNPYYDNGIKVINSKGQKLEAEVEAKVEAYIDGESGEIPLAKKEAIGRTVDYAAGRNRYIGHLISLATRSFKEVKVGLDCSNGSSSSIAKSVFDALGAKTYVINNEPDGTNINTNCGSTHINVLQEYVKENGLDVGFAYDGDADRCIAVDENGNEVETQETYTVAVPISDLQEIYQNIGQLTGTEVTPEQQANADSVYNIVKYGVSTGTEGWIPGADVPFIGADGFCSPIGAGWERRVTSEFGYRRDPFTGETRGHTGMDLAVPTGTPVRAALPGTVTAAQYHSSYGYYVIIDHGSGLSTRYAHNSQLLVRVGQTVETGDIVSLSGSTGRSTGPHLHFEVRVNGQRTDPRYYLPTT